MYVNNEFLDICIRYLLNVVRIFFNSYFILFLWF